MSGGGGGGAVRALNSQGGGAVARWRKRACECGRIARLVHAFIAHRHCDWPSNKCSAVVQRAAWNEVGRRASMSDSLLGVSRCSLRATCGRLQCRMKRRTWYRSSKSACHGGLPRQRTNGNHKKCHLAMVHDKPHTYTKSSSTPWFMA